MLPLLLMVWVWTQRVMALPAIVDFDIWSENGEGINYVNSSSVTAARAGGERESRVLNFFPVPVEEECRSNDGRRKGTCLNPYECRIQGGSSKGPCALGFGVCCVFTATCSNEVFNNITYFVNPDFPDLSTGMSTCQIIVKKIDPEIAQLRLDFIHFNLGQPNRRTGVCDEDLFLVSGGSSRDLRLCGLNSGQHVFFDVENVDTPITITMTLSKRTVSRLWEVRIIQVPFTQRTPSGCLQYHTGIKGIIQTMNFADNGRHLANQEYTICTRQEEGMCSISYEPCDENSFKISPNNGPMQTPQEEMPPGDGEGVGEETVSGEVVMMPPMMDPVDMGGGTMGAGDMVPSSDTGSNPESPQMDPQDVGSGDGGLDVNARNMMEVCRDRIILPCDSEDLIMGGDFGPGFCTMVHCGNSFCPEGSDPCRIESSVTPFTIGVHFGPTTREASAEDNLGMCLSYEQLPCVV